MTQLVSLIGLGIAIDYSLLVVYRFREELRNGLSRDEAIVTAVAGACRRRSHPTAFAVPAAGQAVARPGLPACVPGRPTLSPERENPVMPTSSEAMTLDLSALDRSNGFVGQGSIALR